MEFYKKCKASKILKRYNTSTKMEKIKFRQVISLGKGILSIALEESGRSRKACIPKDFQVERNRTNMSKLFETSEAISIQDVFINYNPISIKENMKSDTCTEKEVVQELRTNLSNLKSTSRNQMIKFIKISNWLRLKFMSMIYCRFSSSRNSSIS